jgi:hypothetical protein
MDGLKYCMHSSNPKELRCGLADSFKSFVSGSAGVTPHTWFALTHEYIHPTELWSENLDGKEDSQDLGVDERIILERIFMK